MIDLVALSNELATLRRCIDRDEEARENAWLVQDDEDEALLEMSLRSMRARVAEIEQLLEDHSQ